MTHRTAMMITAFLVGFIAAVVANDVAKPAEAFTGIPVEVVNHHYGPALKCERWVPERG